MYWDTEETRHSRQIEKWPCEMEKLGREGEYAEVWLVGDRGSDRSPNHPFNRELASILVEAEGRFETTRDLKKSECRRDDSLAAPITRDPGSK